MGPADSTLSHSQKGWQIALGIEGPGNSREAQSQPGAIKVRFKVSVEGLRYLVSP